MGWNIVGDLIQINLFWSIFNLFPIWPLDGGQITGVVLAMFNRRKGMNWAHVVSLVTAGAGGHGGFKFNQMFMGIFFALLAVINFQILQAHHHTAKYGALEEDADWWKRRRPVSREVWGDRGTYSLDQGSAGNSVNRSGRVRVGPSLRDSAGPQLRVEARARTRPARAPVGALATVEALSGKRTFL